MKTRARNLISGTRYNETEHPAICLLVAFAAQNSGIDSRNYGTDWQAFRQEQRSISADLKRFKTALHAACMEGVTDAEVIAAAPDAFSGRLEWHTRTTIGGKQPILSEWRYCTGQYFPTEYRKAAATVLEYATRAVKRSRPPTAEPIETIADLKALNERNGGCWFGKGEMAFFGTRIESEIIRESFFITSEQPPHGPRMFTIRTFDEHGNIKTAGKFCAFDSKSDALEALEEEPQAVDA